MCAEYSCLAAAVCNSATTSSGSSGTSGGSTATSCRSSATTAEENADTAAEAGWNNAAEDEVAPGLLNKSRGRRLWALRVSIAGIDPT